MPYKLKKVEGGFKVAKKSDSKTFSKKPLTKAKAEAQKTAIEISEANKKELTKKQINKLKKHSKQHKGGMRSEHIRNMIKFMKEGDSFAEAHKKAKKLD